MADFTPGPWHRHADGCNQIWTDVGLIAVMYDGQDIYINDTVIVKANALLVEQTPAMYRIVKRLATNEGLLPMEVGFSVREAQAIVKAGEGDTD